MFHVKNISIAFIVSSVLILGGCGGGGDSDEATSTTTSLNGVAQKGPFVKDSNVSLCKLDEKMVCTSDTLSVLVSDDKGSYEFPTVSWSGLSRLTISGYYFDEVTGATSLSPATISAIIEIKSNVKQKKNANILTDLRAKRFKKLIDANKSVESAWNESKEEIQKLFNVNSDDFTTLDLVDFSLGQVSVNAELLRISAAIAKSTNPVSDLEELMKIYNDGGLAAVLESSLYKKLMQDIEDVDMNETMTTLGITSEIINGIPIGELTLAPFARARMSTQNSNQVILSLFATEFTTTTPSITMSVEGDPLSIVGKNVADDNKSIILDMNESSDCKDMSLTFTLEYMDLENVSNPLRTNTIIYSNPMTTCAPENNNSTPITAPTNQLPIAIIGMQYLDEEQAEQNITAYVGERVPGLESSYSHDRDPYPFGGIIHCQWEYNGVIVKESNDVSCDLYNKVFQSAGVYDYTLTVTDKAGATDSNVAHITVVANSVPVVAISPSQNQTIDVGETLNLNATASDADVGDSVTLQWMYQKVGSPTQYGAGAATQFSHLFSEAGDYNVSVIARDTHNATAVASLMVSVNVPQTQNTPPSFNEQNATLNLSSNSFIFTFDSNADWTQNVNSVSIKIDEDTEAIVLNSDDYTLEDGTLTLNVESSNNVALHLPYADGIKIIVSADDYADVEIFIDTVQGGLYEAKAILSSHTQLEENNLDDAVIFISLANSLAFVDNLLDASNFTLQDAPQGLSVKAVEYINQRYANVILAFDGTDINVSKEFSLQIAKDELSSPMDITTNSLNIYEANSGYDDINRTITFHTGDFIHLNIAASEDFTFSILPSEGNASAFKIGNEYWGVDYTHTSCKLSDRIVYDSTNGKGNINIDVEMQLPSLADGNISINTGSRVYEYLLVDDLNVKSVYIYPPEHGTANIINKDGAYFLNYEPDAGYTGTEELALTVNSNMDGCIVSSNIVITVNVSLVKNYEMFSAPDVNGTCHPYVTDGDSLEEISDISLQTSQCAIGYDEYKKVGNKFIFSNVGGSPLYRVNPATLAFSSWQDNYVQMDSSLVVSGSFPTLYSYWPYISWNYENALIYTTYEQDIGTMPWSINTTDNPYLIDDVVGEVDGDQIESNYMQDYSYFNGYRRPGAHIYSVSYDYSNGNGMSLNKSCAFEALESCTSGDSVWYFNLAPSSGSPSDVSLAVDKHNFVYVFDDYNYNLWITVDLNLDVLSMTDQTRLIEDVTFTYMDFQRASNGVVYYNGYDANTQYREIGYFYKESTVDVSNLAQVCSSSCTEANLESKRIEDFFENATLLSKIVDNDDVMLSELFVADEKIYVSTNTGSPLRLQYWYELDMNGTLTELPSQTSEDSKAAFKTLYTMEYINGYIYMIGSDRYDSTKTKMVVVDTKNNNAVTLLEFDKSVTLYLNGLYKNDYNFHKVIYKTQESDGNGAYIYNIYGYNPYKNEKTLLKTYTMSY